MGFETLTEIKNKWRVDIPMAQITSRNICLVINSIFFFKFCPHGGSQPWFLCPIFVLFITFYCLNHLDLKHWNGLTLLVLLLSNFIQICVFYNLALRSYKPITALKCSWSCFALEAVKTHTTLAVWHEYCVAECRHLILNTPWVRCHADHGHIDSWPDQVVQ